MDSLPRDGFPQRQHDERDTLRKIILGLVAATAVAAPIAAVAAPASAAQPTITTANITVPATSWTPIDLPALNSQFTTMTLTATGTAHWGQGIFDADPADIVGEEYANDSGEEYTTSDDDDGHMTAGVHTSTGVAPGWGPILLEHTQVGAMIYRVDGGVWKAVDGPTTVTAPADGQSHAFRSSLQRPARRRVLRRQLGFPGPERRPQQGLIHQTAQFVAPPACAAGGASLRPSGKPLRGPATTGTRRRKRHVQHDPIGRSVTRDQSRPVYVGVRKSGTSLGARATRYPRGRRFLAGQCTALTWPERGRCAGSTGRRCITGQYSTSRATMGLIARSVQMRSRAADESACKPGNVTAWHRPAALWRAWPLTSRFRRPVLATVDLLRTSCGLSADCRRGEHDDDHRHGQGPATATRVDRGSTRLASWRSPFAISRAGPCRRRFRSRRQVDQPGEPFGAGLRR